MPNDTVIQVPAGTRLEDLPVTLRQLRGRQPLRRFNLAGMIECRQGAAGPPRGHEPRVGVERASPTRAVTCLSSRVVPTGLPLPARRGGRTR
jgi:hypothetical protein